MADEDLTGRDPADLWDQMLRIVRALDACGDDPFAEYEELWGKSGGISHRGGEWVGGGERPEPEPPARKPRSWLDTVTMGDLARLEKLAAQARKEGR